MTAFVTGTATGASVIECPGGYDRLSTNCEGPKVAKRSNAMGGAAFVFEHRLPNNQSQPDNDANGWPAN